jgi:hypothetical protein
MADASMSEAAPSQRSRIEYFHAYQAVLASPNLMASLLWGSLAVLSSQVIPFIGLMVWTGYLYECIDWLLATRGRRFPDFDPGRFGEYVTRGLWPSLVLIFLWFVFYAMFFVLYFGTILIVASAGASGEEYAALIMGAGLPLLMLAVAIVMICLLVGFTPLMLRAGMSQDLGVGMQVAWWRDFFRRVGLETVLTTLFVMVTGMIACVLGCALLLFGMYPAWSAVTMANAHLTWQLYELYLARGGEPIPLKPPRMVRPATLPSAPAAPPPATPSGA